ncbi:MAG: nucleotidyltransferase domain-containing protein [Clostridiales bacterium]|nr:nucleotidyltransferase domain-containing protein [Clostridiales bacterium]
MDSLIKQKLREIELEEQIRILHAVESGSRAWGFASPDSDYDVRFIYVREPEFYLQLNKTRDVIEWQLDETLDINGWDLQKALRLLVKSNPTLFEWASSPLVYLTTAEWAIINAYLPDYFLAKLGVYHYLSMAEKNYREYLKRDIVKVKKYLYVLRPILACKWILQKQTPPPMLFSELVASEANAELTKEINRLLAIKVSVPEAGEMQRIEPLNDFIETTLPWLKAQADALPGVKSKGYDELNRLFIDTVNHRTMQPGEGI